MNVPNVEEPKDPNQPANIMPMDVGEQQQLNDLRDLTKSLMYSIQSIQAQNARNAAFMDAVSDIKAAANSLAMTSQVNRGEKVANGKPPCCSPSPCKCHLNDCCEYDIILTHIRVLSMQTEPIDSNIDTMEVRLFASIDGIGAVIPNMFSSISLHKLVNQAGVWNQINQRIQTVSVPKNAPKTFTITIDAVEIEDGIVEAATAKRDEYGTANGTMTLDCCCSTPPVVVFDIDFTGGGQGAGSISAKLTAVLK